MRMEHILNRLPDGLHIDKRYGGGRSPSIWSVRYPKISCSISVEKRDLLEALIEMEDLLKRNGYMR